MRAINQIDDERTKQFAIACYDMNSIAELRAPFIAADKNDLREWEITEDQWREAIAAAPQPETAPACEGCGKSVADRMEHYDWMANNGRFRCQAPLELEPETPCPNADVSNEPWITHTTCSLCAPQPETEGMLP